MVRSDGVSGVEGAGERVGAGRPDARRGAPAPGGEDEGDGAAVGGGSAFDVAVGHQPVDETDRTRVREPDRVAEVLDRRAGPELVQHHQRSRTGGPLAGGLLGRGAQPVGDGEREGAEHVAEVGVVVRPVL